MCRFTLFLLFSLVWVANSHANETDLIQAELKSPLLTSPVEYAALVPKGKSVGYPLILMLHGGGLSRDILVSGRQAWSQWLGGRAVVVTPSAGRSFYLDYKDGSERWESFILGPFLEHLRKTLPVGTTEKDTFIMGISMGGMGALRMAFKHPTKFAAVAALEPGIQPVLFWNEVADKHRFFWGDDLLEERYGTPVDPSHWEANHAPTIAQRDAKAIRKSALRIYLEAGDQDELWLYEGAEFLHRILWEKRIPHEYHLVNGAGHVGASIPTDRLPEAIDFLLRDDQWDAKTAAGTKAIEALARRKSELTTTDHYSER